MIVPSIDLMDGKAVQLKQGKDKMLERDNPLELARQFDRIGEIAVIDLDAAMKKGDNNDVIRKICGFADCRVGGGINTIERAKELISFGASKVIIGSKAFEDDRINHQFLGELARAVGIEHIIIAIDAREREIVTKAWTHGTGLQLFDVARDLEQYASEFLFTCVEKEGGMQGTDMATIEGLKKLAHAKITAAGGVTTMDEIRQLAQLGVDAQLGMALYTGKLDLYDAFIESLNWKSELIPTITCDQYGQVLMVAYSNKDAIRKTLSDGSMCYFSRSRNKLWVKGETSGHVQKFVRYRSDCDQDALLATVEQTNVACHTGSYSCFGQKKFSLTELYDVINERFANPKPGSYTATLSDEKVREKLMEEAQEVVEAETYDEIVWEAADVLYFLLSLMAKSNVEFEDVVNELRRRRRK
ncbi:bifunctional phosphoribosyl-AMP cyclohydrolase/phosphoribosyl-ATP diphosphatase HisIE [candidate division KSB1 bacterium]|nr:bifunctional phosphoribosyl-AMP cyclohydrolase/phosphoribosyl-ATP diphosphatase HisIE [candidate division KSB1 bacterium]